MSVNRAVTQPTLPTVLQHFISEHLTYLGDTYAHLPHQWQIHHANSWTVVAAHCVLRLGDTITLQVTTEAQLWCLGRQCGAQTPTLLESGYYQQQQPYMIYQRVAGKPLQPGAMPQKAGHFLRLLHDTSPPPLSQWGNWPPRRNRRYEIALAYVRQMCGGHHPALSLIKMAHQDTQRPGTLLNHGDFRAANLLLTTSGKFGVIDWSDAHLGSREEDIGGCEPEDIPALLAGYLIAGSVPLNQDVIAGHVMARICSLIAFDVLPATSFEQAWQCSQRILSKNQGKIGQRVTNHHKE